MTSKTQPRPILKKSSPLAFAKPHPVFFSGNESLLQDDYEDEHNCQARYKLEKQEELIEQLNLNEIVKAKTKFAPGENDEEFDNFDESERFAVSSLKPISNPITAQKAKARKRQLSSVYILHSKQIDDEIIKDLVNSTNKFLREFKRSIQAENASDLDLPRNFKKQFLPRLKKFLLTGEYVISDENHLCNLGLTFSEPCISDVNSIRMKAQRDRFTTSRSEEFSLKFTKEKFGITTNNNNNTTNNSLESSSKMVSSIYGSLPSTSYFDSFSSEHKLRESLLIKSIRTKAHKEAKDVNNKSPKEKNKSIVSTAKTTKKIVRFADAFGLDLEKVKIITNNSFMDAFSQSYHEEEEKTESEEKTGTAVSKPFLVLIPLFGLRKADMTLKLEDYIYDYENKIIKCVIKVKNFSFEKRVFARITVNNWKSFYDLDAIFIRSDKTNNNNNNISKTSATNSNYDLFGFCIVIPEKSTLPNKDDGQTAKPFDDCILRVEFALCCVQNGVSYWDNNFGENYKFQCFYNKNN